MNCQRAKDLFSEYKENIISDSLKFTLENHFKECSNCSEEYNEFNRNWDAIVFSAKASHPSDLNDKISAKIDAYEWAVNNTAPKGWKVWFGKSLAYVGATAIIAGIFFAASMKPDSKTNSVTAGFLEQFSKKKQVSQVIQLGAPVLEYDSKTNPNSPLLVYKPQTAVRFELYITKSIISDPLKDAKFNTQGVIKNGETMFIPLMLNETEPSYIWFVYGDDKLNSLTLIILPPTKKSITEALPRMKLTDALKSLAITKNKAIQIDGFSADPEVIINTTNERIEDNIQNILTGTGYSIAEQRNDVVRIKSN